MENWITVVVVVVGANSAHAYVEFIICSPNVGRI